MSEHERDESAEVQSMRERRNTEGEASDRDNVCCAGLLEPTTSFVTRPRVVGSTTPGCTDDDVSCRMSSKMRTILPPLKHQLSKSWRERDR
jgi:hypothetical protein